jgi:hypothetical protein
MSLLRTGHSWLLKVAIKWPSSWVQAKTTCSPTSVNQPYKTERSIHSSPTVFYSRKAQSNTDKQTWTMMCRKLTLKSTIEFPNSLNPLTIKNKRKISRQKITHNCWCLSSTSKWNSKRLDLCIWMTSFSLCRTLRTSGNLSKQSSLYASSTIVRCEGWRLYSREQHRYKSRSSRPPTLTSTRQLKLKMHTRTEIKSLPLLNTLQIRSTPSIWVSMMTHKWWEEVRCASLVTRIQRYRGCHSPIKCQCVLS